MPPTLVHNVSATHDTKVEALAGLLGCLWKNSIVVSEGLFTVGADAFNPREEPTTPEEAFELLCDQLAAFTDNDDGTVSGKASGEDDAGMALLLATSWSLKCIGLHKTVGNETTV